MSYWSLQILWPRLCSWLALKRGCTLALWTTCSSLQPITKDRTVADWPDKCQCHPGAQRGSKHDPKSYRPISVTVALWWTEHINCALTKANHILTPLRRAMQRTVEVWRLRREHTWPWYAHILSTTCLYMYGTHILKKTVTKLNSCTAHRACCQWNCHMYTWLITIWPTKLHDLHMHILTWKYYTIN